MSDVTAYRVLVCALFPVQGGMWTASSAKCRSQWPRGLRVGLRPIARCDCGFESNRWHGCLSVVSVVCCQRSLRRADHSSRGVIPTVARRCMWSRNLEHEEAKARYRAVKNTTTVGCKAKKTDKQLSAKYNKNQFDSFPWRNRRTSKNRTCEVLATSYVKTTVFRDVISC